MEQILMEYGNVLKRLNECVENGEISDGICKFILTGQYPIGYISMPKGD